MTKAIVETKNLEYIALILWNTKNINLINRIFGSLDKYKIFCKAENISLKTEELENDNHDLYIDDNVDNYLGERKESKKVLG